MVCKVIKKGILGAALGAGVLGLLFGWTAPSYVRTAFNKVRHGAKSAVPIQFEIDRARQEVNDLEPAIHQNLEDLVKAEVDVEHLQHEIVATRENLGDEGRILVSLRQALATGERLTGTDESYSPAELKADMARRLDHYKNVKRILADKEQTLKLRKQAVFAARERLNKMKATKLALMTRIEGIETRLKTIEATQAANEFSFDDSALARAKQTVAELDRKLEVMARVTEQEGRYSGLQGLPLPIEPGRDVLKEVDAEFGTPTPDRNTTAGKSL
jgi:hypothetical protein